MSPTRDPSEPATVGPLDRTERRVLVGLGTVALLTAAVGIGAKSFWFDEGYSAELARRPGGEWWGLVWSQEGGAVLHALVLKPWSMVSDSDAWLRFLSVPFSVGLVVLTYFVGRRVIGRSAWAAALALAVNGAFVQYAQEARSYALASCLVLGSTLAFLRAVEEPSRRRLVAYALLAAACPLGHLYTAPFVVAQGLTLLVFGGRSRPWGRWIATGVSIGLAWMSLLVAVLLAGSGDAQPVDEPGDGVSTLAFVPRQFLAPSRILGWILLVLVGLWVARVVGMLVRRGGSDSGIVQVLPPAMVAVPLLTGLVMPQIDLDTSRYFLPVLPFLLIMAVGTVASVSDRRLAIAGMVAVVAISMTGLVHWHARVEKMDARTWTDLLADGVETGDRVLFDDTYGRIVTEHYLHQGDTDLSRAEPLRPSEPFGSYFWDPSRDGIGDCILDELDLDRAVSVPGRTWIVLAVPEDCWSTERVLDTIDSTGRAVLGRTDLDGPATLLLVG